MVLQADDRQFGLVVADINDTEEIVVKPLDKQLKELSVYSGATIMGDGRVALILDVLGIAQRGAVISNNRTSDALTLSEEDGSSIEADENRTLLLFMAGDGSRMGIQLSSVARLEEFQRDCIEYAAGKRVTQYRGEIMPLICLSEYFGGVQREDREIMEVVVYQHDGSSVGLIVDQILDIVEDNIQGVRQSEYPGIIGSVIVDGKVTDLLDAPGVIASALPEFFHQRACA